MRVRLRYYGCPRVRSFHCSGCGERERAQAEASLSHRSETMHLYCARLLLSLRTRVPLHGVSTVVTLANTDKTHLSPFCVVVSIGTRCRCSPYLPVLRRRTPAACPCYWQKAERRRLRGGRALLSIRRSAGRQAAERRAKACRGGVRASLPCLRPARPAQYSHRRGRA